MLIHVKTFNGHDINDSNYFSALENPNDSSTARHVFIEQAESDPLEAGTFGVDPQNKILRIRITDYANRYALMRQLKTWFKRGVSGDLVVTFTDESFDYQLPCKVISFLQDKDIPMSWIAILQTGTTAWRGVTPDVESTWVVTGTSETLDLDVAGFDETYLNVSLTPTGGPASGYLYQKLYRLTNTPGVELGLTPWRITVDTATLVGAGKMQADCDDLRIIDLNTGKELKRWIDNPNHASTGAWVNLDLKKGFALTLLTAVAGSGTPAFLQFTINANTKLYISQMPKTGIVYHGNEWFSYTNTDALNCRLFLGKRGLFGTTVEVHASTSVFYYIQYPLLMKYGNSSVAAPSTEDATYDDTKPLMKLTSTNLQWEWDTSTKFYDADHPLRTGGWKLSQKVLGPKSKVFYIKQDAESGDPAMGFKVESFQVGALWKAENVLFTAFFGRPGATITTVSMTGDKYRSNLNFLTLAALQRYTGGKWVNLWTELTPASAGVWTAWSAHSGVSVATGSTALQLIFQGGYAGAANAYAAFEALTCTVVFPSTYLPTGTFLGEEDAYPLELTVENTHAEYPDAVTLDFVMLLDKEFVIDAEEKSVTYDGVNAHSAMTLDDESRGQFIRLKGGDTNPIKISGADLGTLDVVLSQYRRRL